MHTGIQVGRCDLDQEIAAIDREPVAVFVERLGRQGRQFVAPSGRGASVLPVPYTGDEFASEDSIVWALVPASVRRASRCQFRKASAIALFEVADGIR